MTTPAHPTPAAMAAAAAPFTTDDPHLVYASGIAAERARLAAWLRDLIAHPKGKLIDQVLALANDLDPRPR